MNTINIDIILDKPCWVDAFPLCEKSVREAAIAALLGAQWKHATEMNILLTDDATSRQLNKNFRKIDKPTNVLSFPSFEAHEIMDLCSGKISKNPVFLGDIALSFETIEKEASNQGKPIGDHVVHLVVHGVLHLLGFDHENDDDAFLMESRETAILSTLSIPNPYE
jgi:probable rRNA maturation factor